MSGPLKTAGSDTNIGTVSDDYEYISGPLKSSVTVFSPGLYRNKLLAVGSDNQLWVQDLIESNFIGWDALGGSLSSKYPLAIVGDSENMDILSVREEKDGNKSL